MIGAVFIIACGGGDDDDDDGGGAAVTATEDSGGIEPADETEDATDPTDVPGNGGNGDGGSGDASEACSLLTKEDVEGVFGVSMLEPELIPLPDVGSAKVSSCSFVSGESTDSLSITLYSASEAAVIEGLAAGACENKDSAGVGDRLCWYSEANTEIQMQVGGNFVDIFVTTVDGDSNAITMSVAEMVADSLS